MRYPSIKSLAVVFGEDAKQARAILTAKNRKELFELSEVAASRDASSYHPHPFYVLKMAALGALDGCHGAESSQAVNEEYADYVNTGDVYNPTVIYWRGNYRIQSLGDFIETMQRQGVMFK